MDSSVLVDEVTAAAYRFPAPALDVPACWVALIDTQNTALRRLARHG